MPTPENSKDLISVDDALEQVVAAFRPLAAELVSVGQALGRVLAEDVHARLTQPPAAVSAMDGYAVRAADVVEVPARLRLVGAIAAGAVHDRILGPGEAVRILTGAALPDGADSIVIQENAGVESDAVMLHSAAVPGQHVRSEGLDFRAGETGLRAGRRLTARDLGMAAAMNVPWLRVRRLPRVAILSTGDEIVLPGDPRDRHQIVSANSFVVSAIVREAGGLPIDLGIARDDEVSLRRVATGAGGADLVVTSGGVSVGDRDLVRRVLGEAGFKPGFWRVAMRPGKPLLFGHLGEVPLLGLPGNPVSAFVCGTIFVTAAIGAMLGLPALPKSIARLGSDLAANRKRQDYLRARLDHGSDGEATVTPFATQDSSMLSTLAAADCLLVRPPFAPEARTGERVPIVLI